ncbi:TPR repeat [Nitrosospira sp. Nsp11]|uniref:tetratricopeptide repeat protein n=1 Tax=Nitrosospira sp. Nsp11 TaxID=1855338 RepID=UPI00091F1793|nr:tetratricopeptide repeat protein [Nitrosospira sp. Nsp11]SHL59100.1 TPR repeat [Nitrosospira sp. Nsp11]
MKSDDKKRSYEGTRYDKSSLGKDYSELLQSILDQLTADALNGVPIPPNTAAKDVAWDGRYFWNFVSNLQKDDKEDFENLLSENGASFGTLSKTPYQGATLDNAEIAICTSAQLLKISLNEYIESYIVRCKRRKYDIKGFKGHDETIKSILKKYDSDNIDENEADFEKEEDREDITGNPSQNTPASFFSSQPAQLKLAFPKAKEDNANYYANSLLQVFGRNNQKARLNQFLTCKLNVAWFQLAGDAGQGKSRLAFDLLYDASNSGWHAGSLTEYEIESFKDHWKDWQPNINHLFIFDYVVGREQKIKPILQTLFYNQDKFKHKVRILLIERQRWDRGSVIKAQDQHTKDEGGQPATIGDKAEWFLKLCEEEDLEGENFRSCRFDNGVEELKGLDLDYLVTIVKQLMTRLSGKALTLSDDELKKTLARIDGQCRPLYAYLLAQQLGETQEGFQSWTKFDLLNYQLIRDKRRWKQAFKAEASPTWGDSHSAMKLAVLATIVREVKFQDTQIEQYFGNIDSLLRKEAIAITSGYLINDDNRPEKIHALEPDLLGEWFVLYCFYQGLKFEELLDLAWHCSPNETAIFLQRITQDFIDFSQRHPNGNLVEKLLAHPSSHETYYPALAKVAVEIGVKLFRNYLTIPPNLIVALEHAADSSDTAAMFFLGLLYLKGIGVERNSTRAFQLYHKAAEKGNSDALTHLGFCYAEGNGVVRNRSKAIELYQQAVKRGNSTAMIRLASCYETGDGITKDPVKAIILFQQAADQGDSSALINLGNRYEQGDGIEQDWDKAINLYQRAADQGDSSALINLADRYEQGIGIKQDWDKAIDLYQRAVSAGDVKAISRIQNNLLLQNFLGVKNNKTYKNFYWSNSKLPSQAAVPVFDPPIIAGHWEQLAEERVTACLDRLIASFEILGITKNLTGYKGQYARRLALNFYKDCNLVDIQLYDPSTKDILIVSAVFNTTRAILLTGKRDIIFDLNHHILSFEGKSSTLDYLQFFCSNVLNQHKPYQIITDLNEIPFDTEADQYVIDKIKDSIFVPRSIEFIPRCFEGNLPKEGWEKLEACVLHGNNLYFQTFEVFLNGWISLKDGSCILNELPILQHEYDGIFRKPLRPTNLINRAQ